MKTGKSTMPTYDIRIEVVDLSRRITVLSIYYVCLLDLLVAYNGTEG